MPALQFKSIEDMEAYLYGSQSGMGFLKDAFSKATGPMGVYTDSGVYNPIYGAYAWSLLNIESNLVGLIPKNPWQHSGWRVMTGYPWDHLNFPGDFASFFGGEGATLPTPIKPRFEKGFARPSYFMMSFEMTQIQELLYGTQDDVYPDLAQLRMYMADFYTKLLNKIIGRRVKDEYVAGSSRDPNTDNVWDPLDRIVSAKSERDAVVGTNTGDKGWFDHIFYDRDDTTAYDTVVIEYDNSTDLTPQVNDLLMSIFERSGMEPEFFVVHPKVMRKIWTEYEQFLRFMEPETYAVGELTNEGVRRGKGGAGIRITHLYGKPIFTSVDAPPDRILALNTQPQTGTNLNRLAIDVVMSTTYWEWGASRGMPFATNNQMLDYGVYFTIGRPIAHSILGHGKIIGIQ